MAGARAARRVARRSLDPSARPRRLQCEDAQELDAAAAVSMERLQEVHDRLTGVLPGVRAASDC